MVFHAPDTVKIVQAVGIFSFFFLESYQHLYSIKKIEVSGSFFGTFSYSSLHACTHVCASFCIFFILVDLLILYQRGGMPLLHVQLSPRFLTSRGFGFYGSTCCEGMHPMTVVKSIH